MSHRRELRQKILAYNTQVFFLTAESVSCVVKIFKLSIQPVLRH